MLKRILVLLFGVGVPLIMIAVVFIGYDWVFDSNVQIEEPYSLYVYPEENPRDILNKLLEDEVVDDRASFIFVAQQKKWNTSKPGHYIIEPGMSNNELINMLRAGLQTPVKLILNNIESVADVCGQASALLMVDSVALFERFIDPVFLAENNLNYATVRQIVIPNTYEFYWNTGADGFRERLLREYHAFWNNGRNQKAAALGLNRLEVSTLASIVQKETARGDEMPVVAGLYLNRLRKNMKLQSDPTVIYARQLKEGDVTIRRVLYADLKIDSPYNTYRYAGLPPAPITIPTIQAIDAVLNPQKHNYIFMCADPDRPGYHSFALTDREHARNRKKYTKWLDEQGVRR
jgi:UPF0755 protein